MKSCFAVVVEFEAFSLIPILAAIAKENKAIQLKLHVGF